MGLVGRNEVLVCKSSDFQNGWTVWLHPTSEIVCSLLGNTNSRILSYALLWKSVLAAKITGRNR